MRINATTVDELTPAEAAYLEIPLYGQAIYGVSMFMSRAEAQRRLDEALRSQKESQTMANQNRISAELAAAVKTSIIQKYGEIRQLLTLIPLEPEDKGLSTIGIARAGMHEVFQRHIGNHPEFLPGWITAEEIGKDKNYGTDLADIMAVHNELGSDIADTMTLSSHEDYIAYLACYGDCQASGS